MISSWKCFFIIMRILLVTADQNHEASTGPTYIVNSKDICNLPPDKGSCPFYNHRWYYNSSKNACDLFVYSGCGGNDNRFDFFNDCYKLCIKKADVTTRNDLPPTSDSANYTIYLKPGREGKASPDWNNSSRDENTGVTVDDVSPITVKTGYTRRLNPDREVEITADTRRNTNVDICSQPQEPGHCFRNYELLRWYYDSSNNTCKMFVYSGCGGNDNCFDDFQGCAQVCITKTAKDICNQPKDSGFCLRGTYYYYHLKWYYDNSTNSCKLFYYSGCDGNDNRFYRLQACQQQCVRDETTTDFPYLTDGQMHTSDYIYPGIKTKDWMSSTRTVDWTDWEEENRVVIDVPTSYERRVWTTHHIVGYTLVIVFVCAVLTFIRMTMARCRYAEQGEHLLSSNDEAGRTSSSDDNSSPLRVSVCVISLRNSEQQSSDESTAGYEMPKSDQNYPEAPPAYYPSHPPSYKP